MAKKYTGQYRHVLPNLPRLQESDPNARERVAKITEMIKSPQTDDNEPIDTVLLRDALLLRMRHEIERFALAAIRAVVNDTRVIDKASKYADAFAHVRLVKDALERHVKMLNPIIEAYTNLIVDETDEMDTNVVPLPGGGKVQIQYEPYASVTDKIALREWCEGVDESGVPRYVNDLALPWPKLNAITKELLKKGQPEPPGVKAFNAPKAKFYAPGAKVTEGEGGDEE